MEQKYRRATEGSLKLYIFNMLACTEQYGEYIEQIQAQRLTVRL